MFGDCGDDILGERLREGYDIGAATAVNDPSMMSEFDRVALERDEKFNTRISGYIGWQQAARNLIPTPRNGARFNLTETVLDSGAKTTEEAVELLAARVMRLPLSAQMRNALSVIFGANLGTTFTGWIVPDYTVGEQDDVAFTNRLIDDIVRDYRIDPNRIHATGWSNGALMSDYLACVLSDRIASVAAVARALQAPLLPSLKGD